MTSALEHRILELAFSDRQNPGNAVSAVKALAIAAQQGNWIYQITPSNIEVLDELSIGAEVKDEIRAAAATGKEVTVSESTITVAGWTGAGYIISDPETGAGAYKISGGSNGGFLEIGDIVLEGIGLVLAAAIGLVMLVVSLIAAVVMAVMFAIGAFLGLLVAMIYSNYVLLAAILLATIILATASDAEFNLDSFLSVEGFLLAILGFMLILEWIVAGTAALWVFGFYVLILASIALYIHLADQFASLTRRYLLGFYRNIELTHLRLRYSV